MSHHSDRHYDVADETMLVRWAGEDDKQAFGELYQRYVERIYNYCYYRMGNPQDAEDLTARVFMRAMAHISSYDQRGIPFSAWLYRIAHNLVANWHRDNSRRKVIPMDDYIAARLQSDARPESATEQRQEQEALMASIHQLPEDRQQLLFLKFIERLSNAEIGAIMNRTEGAIKSLYHRTLSALYDDLSERNIRPDITNRERKRRKS